MIRLRELRQAQGWTQAQLGKRVGLAKTTISGYEKEDHQLDPPTIHVLCDLFGCTSDYLLGRSNLMTPPMGDQAVRLWMAYEAASPRDQELVDHILGLDIPDDKKDAAVS